MPYLETCRELLRRLIAKGDTNGIRLAERAINEYLDATPVGARKSGLRLLREDVLAQRNAVLGHQRRFADTVNGVHRKEARGVEGAERRATSLLARRCFWCWSREGRIAPPWSAPRAPHGDVQPERFHLNRGN